MTPAADALAARALYIVCRLDPTDRSARFANWDSCGPFDFATAVRIAQQEAERRKVFAGGMVSSLPRWTRVEVRPAVGY